MTIKDVMNVIGKLLPKAEPKENIPDDETRDKVLRALRRQHRTQAEEQEKIHLRKAISAYQQNQSKHYFNREEKVLTDKLTLRSPNMMHSTRPPHNKRILTLK